MASFCNLIGQRFGMLTVLEPAEKINGKVAWRCVCDCGRERIVTTKHLRNGKTWNCGCSEKPRGLQQMHYIDGTCIEMLESEKIRSNNTSGTTGVCFDPSKNLWRAEIMLQGKRHYLGRYHKKEDAIKARLEAKEHYHNEFIRSFSENGESYEEKLPPT